MKIQSLRSLQNPEDALRLESQIETIGRDCPKNKGVEKFG